jgi:hypothetical protein
VPDSLYLGTLEGKTALFITNDELQRYTEDGVAKSSPFIGLLSYPDRGPYIHPFDFRELESPQQLFAVQGQILAMANYVFDAERQQIFVSLVLSDSGSMPENRIYGVTLGVHDADVLWRNEIGPGSRYGEYQGSANVDQAAGDYLVLSITPCYACEPFPPWHTIVFNTDSRTEKALGQVGEVSIDLDADTVSYRFLVPEKIPCEPSPGCSDDGTRTVYEPAGEVMTEDLP